MNILILFKEISTLNCIYKVIGYNTFEHKCDIFNVGVVKSAKFGNI